jgi:hypothetical protein
MFAKNGGIHMKNSSINVPKCFTLVSVILCIFLLFGIVGCTMETKGNHNKKSVKTTKNTNPDNTNTTNIPKVTSSNTINTTKINQNNINIEKLNITNINNKITGHWIDQNYVNKLKLTKSPYKSGSNGIFNINIQIDNSKIKIYEYYSFHEGGFGAGGISEITNTGNNNCKIKLKVIEPYALNKDDARSIDLSYDGNKIKSIHYNIGGKTYTLLRAEAENVTTKAGELMNKYLESFVIVGEYKDSNNLSYSFGKDGIFRAPNESFKYSIIFDFADGMVKYDYFAKVSTSGEYINNYIFEYLNSKLFIYKTIDTAGVLTKEKEPYLILTKK